MKNFYKNTKIAAVIESVHDNIWARFMGKDSIMYDYSTPDMETLLPTQEECLNNKPNALGWWSPIENGAFFNGVYLLGLLERCKRDPGELLETRIRKLISGLYKLQNVGTTPGFIARGVGLDGKCHYPASSNDQNIPWILGLWKYMNSAIPSESEKQECRKRLLSHLKALKASDWVIPGDKPGFERGCMLTEKNNLECSLASVHLIFCSKLLSILKPDEGEELYQKYLRQKLKDGRCRYEVIAAGLKDFQPSHGWFSCNCQYPLRELFNCEQDKFLKEQFKKGLLATGRAAAPFISLHKDYKDGKALPCNCNWRELMSSWREQSDINTAESAALDQLKIWKEMSQAISFEKRTLMSFATSAWLLMMSGDSQTIDKWIPEILKGIESFDCNRLNYATFFYLENVIQEIHNYCND